MKAYYLDSGKKLSQETLKNMRIDVEKISTLPTTSRVGGPCAELKKKLIKYGFSWRDQRQQDEVSLTPKTPNLETLEANFSREHKHTAPEVRHILEGGGIFDIRDYQDQWIRIEVEAEDFIRIPANRYHRFFLTDAKTIRAKRYYQDDKGWVAIYRDEIT